MSIRSLRAAVSFLTVLPVANADGSPGERLGRAYFPAIGAVVGLAAGVAYVVAGAATTPLLGAAVAVAVLCTLTGAIHLDGLADSADGLLARGADVARRLEVMRDPRLGSYGVTAIVTVLFLDLAAIASMSPARAIAGLIIAGALSRLATLAIITFVPYVRASGLGVAAWDSRHRVLDLAIGAACAAVVCALDWRRALIAATLVALVALLVVILARRQLGGATGDVCGATAELCQLAALLVFAVR
ncbi:MAG TPA: adenosylcobinamide-GDP ribazoletransferase [Candidatus Limnocylindrales bacterium]|nr:adenosylcobinamide-GDP ribazoletransferase [Candidatus Limnocylindrales bacterium]